MRGAFAKSIHSEKLRISAGPPPARTAVPGVMATIRNSRMRSPTNTVLPLITADGLLLKTIPCNFSGAGFGGSGSPARVELVSALLAAASGAWLETALFESVWLVVAAETAAAPAPLLAAIPRAALVTQFDPVVGPEGALAGVAVTGWVFATAAGKPVWAKGSAAWGG